MLEMLGDQYDAMNIADERNVCFVLTRFERSQC